MPRKALPCDQPLDRRSGSPVPCRLRCARVQRRLRIRCRRQAGGRSYPRSGLAPSRIERTAPVADDGNARGMLDEIAQAVRDEEHDAPGFGERRISRNSSSEFLVGQRRVGLIEQEEQRSRATARAISVRCCVASEQSARSLSLRCAMPSACITRASASPSRGFSAVLLPCPTSTFWATVRFGKSCGSWWTTATSCQSTAGNHGRPSKVSCAGIGPLLAGDDADQRALAGAVRSGDAEHLARADVELDAVERDGAAVALGDAPDADAVGGAALMPPSSCGRW